jgi:hypothetical protein
MQIVTDGVHVGHPRCHLCAAIFAHDIPVRRVAKGEVNPLEMNQIAGSLRLALRAWRNAMRQRTDTDIPSAMGVEIWPQNLNDPDVQATRGISILLVAGERSILYTILP